MEELTVVKKYSKCHFCGLSKNDYFKYGVMYKLGNIVAHYYCVLLSSRLIQRGSDDEGLLGFLYCDIEEELNRSLNVLCVYCKKGSATILCAYKKCKRSFHLPCGLKNGCLNQFVGSFKSFCHSHCPVQNIPRNVLKEASETELTCCICYEELKITKNKRDILWAPCCQKTWYHMLCVQKLACSAGYFFRCPACNDIKTFSQCVQKFGIFIPQQDASWELVPNAFEELLFRYNNCDAEVCLCPQGRQGNEENQQWEVVLCESCGSQGIHVACGGFKHSDADWECSDCQKITKSHKLSKNAIEYKGESSNSLKNSEIYQKKRRRGSEDLENLVLDKRKKFKQDLQEEEIEIDVETVDGETKDDKTKRAVEKAKDALEIPIRESLEVEDLQEALTSVRPGPLSYKLGLIRESFKKSRSRPMSLIEERKVSVSAKTTNIVSEEERDSGGSTEMTEVKKQTSKNCPSLTFLKKPDLTTSETKKSCDMVIFSHKFAKAGEQSSYSFDDFDILTVATFHSSGGKKKNDGTVDILYENDKGSAAVQGCSKRLSVYPVTLFEKFPQYRETEASTQKLELIEFSRKKEGWCWLSRTT